MCPWIQDGIPVTPLKKKPGSPKQAASSSNLLSPVKSQICPRRDRESRPASFGQVKAPEKLLRPAKGPLLQPKVEGDEAMQIVARDEKASKDDLDIDSESEDKGGM